MLCITIYLIHDPNSIISSKVSITDKASMTGTCDTVLYTAKFSRGKTFAVVHKTHHSLENFRSASGPCHYVLYTANDSREKLSRLANKPRKFSPSKVLPYTVFKMPCYCTDLLLFN